MSSLVVEMSWSNRILLITGCVLVGVGLALAIAGRPAPVVATLTSGGLVALALGLLIGRASEGTVEAGGAGFKLAWKEEITRQVGGVLEAEVSSLREEPSGSFVDISLGRYSTVHYEDINRDGITELLVEHPVGAHARVLKVFGWIDQPVLPEFGLIGEMNCGLGGPFTVGDLDGDGVIEVALVEVDWSKDGAFTAGGPYIELLYRWDEGSDKFVEVGRKELGSPSDFSDVSFAWYRWASSSQ